MPLNFPDAPTTNQVFGIYRWDSEKWILNLGGLPVGSGPTLDFPSSPAFGQFYRGYSWDNEKWVMAGGGIAPPGAIVSEAWFNGLPYPGVRIQDAGSVKYWFNGVTMPVLKD